jgi:peptidoglycan/LPS O-acetylase OafA/YrhL
VRLFPAYFLVLLACLAATAVRGYGGTSRGAVLSFLYVANWGSAQGQGLGLLRHTWSLSIEEQFYILWPITVLLLIGLVRYRFSSLTASIFALMGASYGLALLLLHTGTSPTWVSNATPTRAGMLLAGAFLAAGLGHRDRAAFSPRWVRLVGVAGGIGFIALLGLAMLPSSPYRSGWGLVSVLWPSVAAATALIVAAAVLAPSGSLGRLLSVGPLIALGKRSYGFYLWHFPIFTILDTEFHGLGAGQIIGGAALALLLTVLSYRFVEQPLIVTFRSRQHDRLAPAYRAGPTATRALSVEQT